MADFIWPIASMGILALIIMIGILLLWKTIKEKKSGFPLADERTRKLNWKAGYCAMFIGQYFILAYMWVTFLGKEFFSWPEVEAGYPLIAAILVSSVSFVLLRWLLGRKGEP